MIRLTDADREWIAAQAQSLLSSPERMADVKRELEKIRTAHERGELFLGLFCHEPSRGIEAEYGGYARASLGPRSNAFVTDDELAWVNTVPAVFPVVRESGPIEVTYWAIFDSKAGGTPLLVGWMKPCPWVLEQGTVPVFSPGSLRLKFDPSEVQA
jgi:hypothetical protein